ncbi:lysozyme inhibitor LprI family protein [Phenylobacterium sp.]|uniref:lysozyme inhibitor LprI family protein n=1 Tax=Phenylobacterium sp. TaxID=1871053 RepID=UPI00272F7A5A|nr:lysozyme inhibitor LprI family protein [Phenylobacterium sp.]MDP1616263.1 lysozyme inhibitor LprI family protein [Phenylobacterium sp.]
MNLDSFDPAPRKPDAGSPAADLRIEPLAPPPPAPRRRGLWISGGLLVALVGVAALGLTVSDELPDMAPEGAQTLDIEVADQPAPPPAGAVAPGAPLDVLPEDMAQAAPHNPPPVYEPPPEIALAEAPPEPGPPARPALRQPANLTLSPSFDCRRARSQGERVVCADPALAEADQRLNAAYQQALAAGVPDWRLERQQRRWLRAREDAAFAAPQAVAEVYEARIAELEAQADVAPPETPPWPSSW